MNPDSPFNVLCREDMRPDGTLGNYVLATSRHFATKDEAIHYAKSVAPSRFPIVVQTVWGSSPPIE